MDIILYPVQFITLKLIIYFCIKQRAGKVTYVCVCVYTYITQMRKRFLA